MHLMPFVDDLRHQLLTAAAPGGDDARELAERLVAPLESAARLVLLDALSAAAAEITSELAPGSVDLRLRGREAEFVVTAPPSEPSDADDSDRSPTPAAADTDDGASARLTLRLSEQLKGQIEAAAGRDGLSVNAWLVRAASSAADTDRGRRPSRSSTQQFSGWVR